MVEDSRQFWMFAKEGVTCSLEAGPFRTGDVLTSAPGNARLRTILPDLRFEDPRDGLRETVGWFTRYWKP